MLRRFAKSAMMSATGMVGDSPLFAADYLLRFLRVAVLLSLWRMILAGRGEVSGMTLGAVLTYTLLAEVFSDQLSARAGMEDAFWQGDVAKHYLQPLPFMPQFVAEMTGRWMPAFLLFSLPLLLCAPLLGVRPLPSTLSAGLLFLPSLLLGIMVGLALDFIFSALMVTLDIGIWVMAQLRTALTTLFSGAMLPLALLPWGWGHVFSWLPFASMASAPLRIVTGTGDPVALLGLQLFWTLLLWPLAGWMWWANRERVVSYGG